MAGAPRALSLWALSRSAHCPTSSPTYTYSLVVTSTGHGAPPPRQRRWTWRPASRGEVSALPPHRRRARPWMRKRRASSHLSPPLWIQGAAPATAGHRWAPGPRSASERARGRPQDRLRLWRVRRREHNRLGVETESGDGAQVARHIASRLWQVNHHVDAAEVRVRGAEVLRTDLVAETDLGGGVVRLVGWGRWSGRRRGSGVTAPVVKKTASEEA